MIGRYITYFEQQTLKDPVAKKALYCGFWLFWRRRRKDEDLRGRN